MHDDDLDYAPRPTAHERVFGRPPIALPDKVTMKDDAGSRYWGSEEERSERWAERTMRAESLKVVYPVVDDGLDYAPSLKDLPVHERVFGRPPIALPDKEQQHEHQRHHQDVADHAGPLRTSHHL